MRIICSKCGKGNLVWAPIMGSDNQYRLGDRDDPGYENHRCPPDTPAAGLIRPDPTPASKHNSADELKTQARDAVMDAMAGVSESFTRTIDDIAQAARISIDASKTLWAKQIAIDVDSACTRAIEEFRSLMPQTHELTVHTPTGDVTSEGRPHFQLHRMVNWLNLREHVWAAGPAGSGKTTAASQAADVLGLPAYVLPCGMATNDWSLLGFTNPDGKYIPGHMRKPFEQGGVFVLDEIDNTNPSVLTTINGALSGQSYMFPDGLVQRHPDFVVVGCANTWGTGPDRMYVGRNQLDAATLDRFKRVDWQYDKVAELDWAGRDQIIWTQYVQRVRQCAAELSMRVVVSPRASIGGAKGLRNGLLWVDVAEDCLWNGMSLDDSTRILGIVGAQ